MDNEKNEVLQDVSFVLISDFLAYILESDVAVPTLASGSTKQNWILLGQRNQYSYSTMDRRHPRLCNRHPFFPREWGSTLASPCSTKGAWLSRNTVFGLLISQITKNARKAILKVTACNMLSSTPMFVYHFIVCRAIPLAWPGPSQAAFGKLV